MAGVYIHIPFCSQACSYCNFHFSTSLKQKDALLQALIKEISGRSQYLSEPIDTLYFGGGTPSLLTPSDIGQLLEILHKSHDLSQIREFTFEANPEDLSLSYCRSLRSLGIDRLSIGIQSFFEEDLRLMNRVHNSKQALLASDNARKAGFENFNIDLIYGLPWSEQGRFAENLAMTSKMKPTHLSAYALTVEDRTALAYQIKTGRQKPVEDDQAFYDFGLLQEWARTEGWSHYEISNLSQPGMEALHNSSYWKGEMYVGYGPAAHSFNGHSRQWNIANNARYIRQIEDGLFPFELEELSPMDRYNEYIMTGLRLDKGISLTRLQEFEPEFSDHFMAEAAPKLEKGSLIASEDRIYLPDDQRFFADGHAADLFAVS